MGKTSGIEWTDATWNPWMGCTKVSEGCKNCYMFREQERYGHDPTTLRKSKTQFDAPLRWKEPRKIFVCSWSDFFHEDAWAPWVKEAKSIMEEANWHTYLLLTKRPERARDLHSADWWGRNRHVWLGVSVENARNIRRVSILQQIPAWRKFISAEPLLGPLSLIDYLHFIDWVITGGESGYDPRPMELNWAADIRDQCIATNTAYFHKQHGGKKKIDGAWGGRVLDGRTWSEFPDD